MIRRDQARVDAQPTLFDGKIVIAAVILQAAHLDHTQPAPFRPEIIGQLFKRDDAMRDRVKL